MKICLIAAVSHNGYIGHSGEIPWTLPPDLRHFQQTTVGHPTIMGRKTYESLGKALSRRPAIVVSKSKHRKAYPDAIVVDNFNEALKIAASHNTGKVFVIGGESIYTHYMEQADELYLTHVNINVEGDTKFPHFQHGRLNHPDWRLFMVESREYKGDDGLISFEYRVYRRK